MNQFAESYLTINHLEFWASLKFVRTVTIQIIQSHKPQMLQDSQVQLNTSAAYVLVAPGAWDHWKPKSGAHIDPHEASRYIHSLESWTSHPNSQGQATFLLTPTAVKTQSPFPVGWPWHIPPGCKFSPPDVEFFGRFPSKSWGYPNSWMIYFMEKKTKKNGGFRRAPIYGTPIWKS